jgi:hypothetical protein
VSLRSLVVDDCVLRTLSISLQYRAPCISQILHSTVVICPMRKILQRRINRRINVVRYAVLLEKFSAWFDLNNIDKSFLRQGVGLYLELH